MVWARDMGDSVNHGDSNMVYVLAGGAGGYLKHSSAGHYLDAGGGAHIEILKTCADATGIDYPRPLRPWALAPAFPLWALLSWLIVNC